MNLSDVQVKKSKAESKAYKLSDGGGMYLEVMPNGSKYWRLKYRFDGKEKKLALGVYPDVSLALARERRQDARGLLAKGVDPSENKKAIKAAKFEKSENSFEVVAREWLASHMANKAAINTKPMATNQGCKGLVPNENLAYKYLFYFLQANVDLLNDLGSGATFKELSGGKLKEVKIPLAPLAEQQRIVAILDQAFEGIAKARENAEQNLQNARALFESHLQSVFTQRGEGWVENRLKEVCEKITDGTHQTPTYFESGVVFLSSRNVTSGTINWENIKYIDTQQHIQMHKRVAPRLNDILLAKNGTTGVAAMVDKDVVFDIYVSLALLRPLNMLLPNLLLYFINSPVAKVQFNKRLKGTGVPNLHLEEIREVVISFPKELAEQENLIKQLDVLSNQVKRLEALYKCKITLLDELKKSLLQQAFAGEL